VALAKDCSYILMRQNGPVVAVWLAEAEDAMAALARQGVRPTAQRFAVLCFLAEAQEPQSLAEIAQGAGRSGATGPLTISAARRTLAALEGTLDVRPTAAGPVYSLRISVRT
jgi:hypothetical protein